MDPVHRFSRPALRRPRAIVALEGWSDACDAASGVASYLVGQHDVEPFAAIDPEEFFDFQERRPIIDVDAGGTRSLSWPTTQFFGLERPEWSQDLIVVLGEEPNLRWKTFARELIRVLEESGVEQVITLGAFIGQVAHTMPVPIIGVATDPELIDAHNLLTSNYEGPTSLLSVILEACREQGLPAISLWAAVPHYLAANANPRVMLALLDKAADLLDVEIDTAELRQVALEFDEKVGEAMESSDDLTSYVARLEEKSGEFVGETVSEQLITDIESFLRDQD
ncbi:MAG: PAC2 family protein [Acidimicrobiia bacterium]|nr:PAC2 family protein [Acidimicrobiia bacterium]